MTLKEMGGEYRAQALVLQARIRELREACRQAETEGEKEKLRQRIWALAIIWQETREQAALLAAQGVPPQWPIHVIEGGRITLPTWPPSPG